MNAAQRWRRYPKYLTERPDWLGALPSHWDVMRIRHLFRVVNGATPKSAEAEFWDGDITWVTPDDLQGGWVRRLGSSARSITREGYLSCGTTLTPPGSLIVSTRAPIGYVALTTVLTCTNQGCRTLVGGRRVVAPYYFYVLIAAGKELASRSNGTTFFELSTQQLKDVSVPVPPLSEQQDIADFLDREVMRVSRISGGLNDAMFSDLPSEQEGLLAQLYRALREFRSELILNAVLGTIDVSKAA